MIGNAGGAGEVGMDPIGLVQIGHPGYTLEEERNERHFVFARQILKHLTKRSSVLFPVVRRRFHATEENRNASLLRSMDQRLKVLFHLRHRQTSQPVVCTQREDEQPHVALECPVGTAQSIRRGITRHAGIDDLEAVPFLFQLALKQSWICLLRR